jgi:signal transduction histidine kinase/CheY-like chemotaxis protein
VRAEEITRVELRHDESVVTARQRARDVAELLGFDRMEQTRIATAVSELARNAHRYATGGQVRLVRRDDRLEIEVTDNGPGIPHLDDVLGGRYESQTGMGRGLVGVRLMMDDFDIDATPGRGTRVTVAKRLPADAPAPAARDLRDELSRRGARSPYDEVSRQNEELLQALGEVRARQQELVALNRELEDTNRGVVALYAELDDRADRLRDADERKSRFLADMSHELRTPLNSIVALTELLLSGDPALVGEQVKQVEFVRQMAEEQLRVVGDLLDIAKIEAGHLDLELLDISVPELFTGLRGQLRPLALDGSVELRFDVAPDLPTLCTDEAKLVQILRNLVSNALKFSPGGEVVVAAEPWREGDGVAFRVADTGIGIAPGDLARVFDEFVQIPGEHQRRRKGTGLGLPLASKLAAALGGSIHVESEPGRGTVFTVRMPSRPRPEGGGDDGGAVPDVAGTVLVVDDDETARYVVEAHLRDSAWRLTAVDGGEAALEAVRAGRPTAIVLDLSMPGLDGLEVLRRLRERPETADVPVIVHTSRLLDERQAARIDALNATVLDKSTTSRATLLEVLNRVTGAAHGR